MIGIVRGGIHKRRWFIRDAVLFGKYQLIRILGQGRSGTVYLALHMELEEYRAVKRVPRSSAGYEQFRREALLLKRLRHPGIPIVYDLEEDSQFSYLIEEFLEGDSFYDLVRTRGPLNQDAAVRYGIQICGLVQYLHSAEDIPILYLDLQPRNLLLCHGQVKLLDFDHSDTLTGANAADSRYGTEGFAAPEQQADRPLGVYTDVYQIGAVLHYLVTGHSQEERSCAPVPGPLGAVIRRCLQHDAAARYASAEEVGEALGGLYPKAECSNRSQTPPLTIALAGARNGAGVTHIAIGMAAWLDRAGFPALCEERNHSNDVRAMGEMLGLRPDSYGIYRVMGIPMKPRYGRSVRLKDWDYPVVVRDYGTELEEMARDRESGEISRAILVCGGKWWDWRRAEEAAARLGTDVVLLYSHAVSGAVRRMEGRKESPCFRVPEFADPFHPDAEADAFYRAVTAGWLTEAGRGKQSGRAGGHWKARMKKHGAPL